jgi:hypothetical protein
MENQVFNFIAQTLVLMNIAPTQIVEDADLVFDLNLGVNKVDSLFASLENQYHLHTPLMFCQEVASLKGLAHYIVGQGAFA